MELFRLFGTIAVNNDEANNAITETTGHAERGSGKMISAFKKIGAAVAAAFAVDKIIAFGKAIVDAAAEVGAEQSAFEQIMGDYANTATQKVNEIADATGMVSTRLTPYMTSMTAKFKGLGYDISNATDFASRGLNLAADAAAFWDKSLDESMSHLNSFINGSYEGGEAIGLFANDTQMAAYAVEQGLISDTKAWASLDEATKQATRLEYAENMFTMSGATGQAAKEAEQYANVQANLNEKWRQFKAQIGEPLLKNVVIPAMSMLSGIVDVASEGFNVLTGKVELSNSKFAALEPIIQKLKDAFVFLEQTFSPVIETIKTSIEENLPKWKESFDGLKESFSALQPLFEAVGTSIIGILGFIGASINAVIGAIDGIIQTLSGVIEFFGGWCTVIIGLVTGNSEQVQEGWHTMSEGSIKIFEGLWNAIVGIFQGLVDGIVAFAEGLGIDLKAEWESIKTKATEVWNNIKTKATEIWSNIKTTIQEKVQDAKDKVSETFTNIKTTIEEKLNAAKTTVTNIFGNIKDKITEKIEGARDKVKEAIEKIKGFFNFSWSLPKLKLPHISISGSFSLDPPSVPTFSISWYKKAMDNAMLLNSPTIFGMKGGSLLGGGEAGTEVVSGANTLINMIKNAVREETNGTADKLERLISLIADYLPDIANNSNRKLVLDSGVLVGQLAPQMDSTLGDINRLRGRGK